MILSLSHGYFEFLKGKQNVSRGAQWICPQIYGVFGLAVIKEIAVM